MAAERVTVRYVKLTEHATVPAKATLGAAGSDLCSAYDYVLEPRGKVLAATDLRMEIPEGYYGRIAPRSGMAWRYFIDVGAGVIDGDYRGNVSILLYNFGVAEYKIRRGQKIAQFVLEKIGHPVFVEVKELGSTIRGNAGFGSTDADP